MGSRGSEMWAWDDGGLGQQLSSNQIFFCCHHRPHGSFGWQGEVSHSLQAK